MEVASTMRLLLKHIRWYAPLCQVEVVALYPSLSSPYSRPPSGSRCHTEIMRQTAHHLNTWREPNPPYLLLACSYINCLCVSKASIYLFSGMAKRTYPCNTTWLHLARLCFCSKIIFCDEELIATGVSTSLSRSLSRALQFRSYWTTLHQYGTRVSVRFMSL